MSEEARLGEIVRLQIQREPLKNPGSYDPEPLMTTDQALVSAAGMIIQGEGGWLLDAHHRAHPRCRGGGRRVLSIGFTGHYEAMRRRFGEVPDGVAGENILIDGPALRLGELGDGITIRSADGASVELRDPTVAAPCVEFTSYLMGADGVLTRDVIRDELAFLDDGTRGYIVEAEHLEGYESIAIGDVATAPQ